MSKAGRPRRTGEPPTRMQRMGVRLADMLTWVCKAEGVDAAEMLEIILRPAVESRYRANYELIQKMKAKQDESAIERGAEVSPPLPPLPDEPASKPAKKK